MQRAKILTHATIAFSLTIGEASSGTAQAKDAQLPNCTGWSNCNPGQPLCKFEGYPPYIGPTIVTDAVDGLSGDGRGPYVTGSEGVRSSMLVQGHASLSFVESTGITSPRTLTMNLNRPVSGGGGTALGIVTVGGDNLLYTAWKETVVGVSKSLVGIPVGQTVSAGQINLSFHLDGRFHVLQMGPEAYGHCHGGADSTHVHGMGTSAGTIYRSGPSSWVIDLPAGSVGRLFDVSHTTKHAADKGLYYVRLHYEIVNAIPEAAGVLRKAAETHGGAEVVARYGSLKRDSAHAYVFSEGSLNSAGYWLLDNKKPRDALLVFRLSTEEYATGSDAFEGLGEAYLALGDTAKAIANCRQSLKFNPKNQDALDVLRRLGIRP